MTETEADLQSMSAERVAEFRKRFPIAFFNARPSARAFYYEDPKEHSVIFLFGPNRSGKSEGTVGRACIALTGINPLCMGADEKGNKPIDYLPKPPVKIRHCVTSMERVGRKIVLQKYLKYLPPSMLDESVGKQIKGFNREANTLYLKNGSYVEFVSYDVDPSQWASASFDIIIFDEPPPESVYLSQYARILDCGGVMWGAMTLNARECTHNIRWVDRRIRRYGDGPHVAWYKLKPGENIEMLKREHPETAEQITKVYKAWETTLSADERLAAIEGEPSWLGGMVWPEFDPHVHCQYTKIAPRDFAQLVRLGMGQIMCSFDHGASHPTVCLWFYVAKKPMREYDIVEGDHIGLHEYWRRHAHAQDHAPMIAKINEWLGVKPTVIWAGPSADLWGKDGVDGQGNPSISTFYHSRPWQFPMRKANDNHSYGYACVAEMLRPRANSPFNWPRLRFCKGQFPHTIEEVLGLVYDPKWDENKNKDKIVDREDDCPDCLRYMATQKLWLRPGERFVVNAPLIDPIVGLPMMHTFGGSAAASIGA